MPKRDPRMGSRMVGEPVPGICGARGVVMVGYLEGVCVCAAVVGSGVGVFSRSTTSLAGVGAGVMVGVGAVPEKKAGRDIFTWGNIF